MVLAVLMFFGMGPLLIGTAQAFSSVDLKAFVFSYQTDAEPFYRLEKTKQYGRTGNSIVSHQPDFYDQTSENKGMDKDLTSWNPSSVGPGPDVFRVRLRVHSFGNEASKPLPVRIVLYAKVGKSYVDQKAFLVDQDYLQRTAQWRRFGVLHGNLPVMAPNEMLDYFSPPIQWGHFLSTLQDEQPVALKAVLYLDGKPAGHSIQIPVSTGHFAMDDTSQ